jgi:autotransporter-associated beta strand protein
VQNSATSVLALNSTVNTFTGGVIIKSGTVATTFGLGAASNIVTLGDVANTGASAGLTINGWNSLPQPLNVVGTGTRALTLAWSTGGQTQNITGGITLNNTDLTIRSTGAAGIREFSAISGTGNITIANGSSGIFDIRSGGVINFAGTFTNASTGSGGIAMGQAGASFGANVTSIIQNSATSGFGLGQANGSFVGTAQVLAGAMYLQNTASLKSANEVFVGTSGTLDVQASNTIAGLSNVSGVGGKVTNSSSSANTVLTVGGSGSYTFGGSLSDGSTKNLGLTKAGSGTQTLTGASTYTGVTTVSGGSLIVSGSLAGTTSVAVANGATLSDDGFINSSAAVTSAGVVQGQGSIGAVTISGNGTLAPGSSAASSHHGTLTANGDLSLTDSTSAFSIRLGVDSASDNDALAMTLGNISLNGATLQLSLGASYARQAAGFTYVIIDGLAANSSIAGMFSQGTSIAAANGDVFNILYNVDATGLNAGNDVVLQLQAVPEPSTWAMVFAGAGMLSLAQRLRKRRA